MRTKLAVASLCLILLVACAAPGSPTQVAIQQSPPPPTLPARAEIGDGGLLSGKPCTAPCVYGIRIGETSLEQVIPVLQDNGLAECQREDSLSWIGITCGYSVVVQVDQATSLVNGSGFYPSVPIPLGGIIEKYGEPDFVAWREADSPEGAASRIYLFWDGLRMTVEMPQIEGHLYALEKTTAAEMVLFLDEILYVDSHEVSFGEFYQHWQGYGTYPP